MAKRHVNPEPPLEYIRDEAIHIPVGDTRYVVDLDEQTVDQLALGVCPEDLAQRMFNLLSWRREAIRATTNSG